MGIDQPHFLDEARMLDPGKPSYLRFLLKSSKFPGLDGLAEEAVDRGAL